MISSEKQHISNWFTTKFWPRKQVQEECILKNPRETEDSETKSSRQNKTERLRTKIKRIILSFLQPLYAEEITDSSVNELNGPQTQNNYFWEPNIAIYSLVWVVKTHFDFTASVVASDRNHGSMQINNSQRHEATKPQCRWQKSNDHEVRKLFGTHEEKKGHLREELTILGLWLAVTQSQEPPQLSTRLI